MSVNLRDRIALVAYTGLVVLALVVIAAITSTMRVRHAIDRLTDLHLAAESFRSVSNGLLRLEVSERGYLLTGDSSYLVRYDSASPKQIVSRTTSRRLILLAVHR